MKHQNLNFRYPNNPFFESVKDLCLSDYLLEKGVKLGIVKVKEIAGEVHYTLNLTSMLDVSNARGLFNANEEVLKKWNLKEIWCFKS